MYKVYLVSGLALENALNTILQCNGQKEALTFDPNDSLFCVVAYFEDEGI